MSCGYVSRPHAAAADQNYDWQGRTTGLGMGLHGADEMSADVDPDAIDAEGREQESVESSWPEDALGDQVLSAALCSAPSGTVLRYCACHHGHFCHSVGSLTHHCRY